MGVNVGVNVMPQYCICFAVNFQLYRWYRSSGDFQLIGARGAFALFYRTVSAEVDV